MSKVLLEIRNLKVGIDDKEILKGIDLDVKPGEIHVIMGPNGAGKSTLASALMGHPDYYIESGSVKFNGKNLLDMSVDERAREGLFLAMQYPSEIEGVSNVQFLRGAINTRRNDDEKISLIELYHLVEGASEKLKMPLDYAGRNVNSGFSGGEKKKNEILQMMLLEPKLAILDEIDSGLDIDAIKIVGEELKKYSEKRKDFSLIIITHYPRLLDYITPDKVHVVLDGKIYKSGDASLIEIIEKNGYDSIIGD